jgi:hypothetical protein
MANNTTYNTLNSDPYKNPLSDFRSYTYHMALVATSSKSNLVNIESQGTLEPYTRTTDNKFEVLPGDYVILFNSTTDAEFYIKTLKIDTQIIISSGTKHRVAGTDGLGTTMSMVVVEPYTMDFINSLLQAAEALGVGFDALTLGLKIWFTGYRDTPEGNVEHILDITPFCFNITKIQMSITHAGSQYAIDASLTELTSGVNTIGNVGGGTFVADGTLKDGIASFNEMLDRLSTKNPLLAPAKEPGKFVTYKVIIDPIYNEARYKLDNVNINLMNQYENDIKNPQTTNKSLAAGRNINITTQRSDVISSIIEKVFSLSLEVQKDLEGVKDGDSIITYKPKVLVSTIPTPDGLNYIFYVQRQQTQVRKINQENETEITNQSVSETVKTAIENNSFFQFEYIYTGKNTEVLQFLIDFPVFPSQLGTNVGISAPTSPAPLADVQKIKDAMNALQERDINTATVASSLPMFILEQNKSLNPEYKAAPPPSRAPTTEKTNDNGNHTVDPSAYLFFRKRLSNYVSNNPATANAILEIRGNPYLLNSISLPPDIFTTDDKPKEAVEIQQKLEEFKNTRKHLGGFMSFTPVVHVNIRVPKSTKFQGKVYGGDTEYENAFSTQFWGGTYFEITRIEQSFDNGTFIQRLALQAQSTEQTWPSSQVVSKDDRKVTKDGHTIPSEKKDPSKPVPDVPRPVKGTNRNRRRAEPTPEQKAMIKEISDKYGLDPNLVEAVVRQESGFNPDAKSGAGAGGLMQLMPGTAKDLGVSNVYNQRDNVIGGAGYLNQLSRKYNGDLDKTLAAYNWGPGNVDKHLRANGGSLNINTLPRETRNYVNNITNDYGSSRHSVPPKVTPKQVRASYT